MQRDGSDRTWVCVMQYVVEGTYLSGLIFHWPAATAAEAAQQASRLELAPGCRYHRISVAPLDGCEHFRWLGINQIESERTR